MSSGGEAAEQVVRLSTDGAEFVLRIAGKAAEHIIAILMALSQSNGQQKSTQTTTIKLSGQERLKNMLKSGAELKFFEIKGADLKQFAAEAKRYGLAYCVARKKNDPDGMAELMARAEDAPKITRIMERLELRALDGGAQVDEAPAAPEQGIPAPDGLDLPPETPEGQAQPANPTLVRQNPEANAAKRTSPTAGGPSAPSSPTRSNDGGTTSDRDVPASVKDFLEEAEARQRNERRERKPPAKSQQPAKAPKHKSQKPKKAKEK